MLLLLLTLINDRQQLTKEILARMLVIAPDVITATYRTRVDPDVQVVSIAQATSLTPASRLANRGESVSTAARRAKRQYIDPYAGFASINSSSTPELMLDFPDIPTGLLVEMDRDNATLAKKSRTNKDNDQRGALLSIQQRIAAFQFRLRQCLAQMVDS